MNLSVDRLGLELIEQVLFLQPGNVDLNLREIKCIKILSRFKRIP